MADIHTCSYQCDRPECIRAQRDELRDRMETMQRAAPTTDDVRVALEVMETHWGGYAEAKRIIRSHIEGLEADAARYRWLRAADWERRALSVPRVLAGRDFPESDEHLSGDALDAAIDAARRE